MEQTKYKLPSNKVEYITAAGRRYFPEALRFCQEHNIKTCRVNRMYYDFDFANSTVRIMGPGDDRFWKYQMITC